MRKTRIYLNEADDKRLQEAAARRGSSRTDVIGEAVRRFLDNEDQPPRRPRPLGTDSGHTDTSHRVDELLGELGFGR